MRRVREPRHPLEKRELLHREPPDAAKINAIAKKLIDEGRHPEAVDYIEVTRDPELIADLERDALARGSAFLLQQVERLRGARLPKETWVRAAKTAVANGRYLDGVRAYTSAEMLAEAEQLRQEKCPDYDPFKPLGK